MKKFTFSNKDSKINATIDNNVVTYEDGNSYTISARYGADGVTGAYITVDGVTYSLKAADFKQVADELVPYMQAQPKRERKTDGGAVKAKNFVKLADASVERLTVLLADALLKRGDDLLAHGAVEDKVNDATLNVHKYFVNAEYRAKVDGVVKAEVEAEKAKEDAERAERERKAKEAATDKIVSGIMVAYGVNRATAEAMARALTTVNVELPQA
mgnify:CR=1 FL=1